MADRFDSDSRPHLSVTPPHQISKDAQGSDNPIPLSPQWLLPKPGESKPGLGSGETHFNLHPSYGNRSDVLNTLGNGEETHDIQKKKDVFRPSLLDMETGRRDRWRDEERDSNSSLRKDRWRDADKELGDNRRTERWMENSSTRHFGESRRVQSERWTDSGHMDSHHDQRRESKWNTRWGPNDKETEGLREKWGDSGKDGDIHHSKGLSHGTSHGKDDRDGDHYRPWRSSTVQNRGKVPPSHHQTPTPNKPVSAFSHSRGRGENNVPPTFSLGRGRISSGGSSMNSSSNHSQSLGPVLDRFDGGHPEPSLLKYSRMKLLDVYRMTDLRMNQTIADGFVPVPSLTVDEPLGPLALSAPNSEELTVLKGIDKGDIVSSGAPQITKDGWNSFEPRQIKLGSREDLPHALDECKEEIPENMKAGQMNHSDDSSYERHMPYHGTKSNLEINQEHETYADNFKDEDFGEEGVTNRKADEVPINREASAKAIISYPGTWQVPSMGDRKYAPDWRENQTGMSSRTPDKGLLQPAKDLDDEWESNLDNKSYTNDDARFQTGEGSTIRMQLSGMDKEQQARKLPQSSPEDLWLYYKDPYGVIQGPFTGLDIIGWFEGGYFGLDLPVRVASASNDLPFSPLGDVMPHLRAKAKPPPGFAGPKQNETTDTSSIPSFNGLGKIHTGLAETEMLRNESRHKPGSTTEAENWFLESLISGNSSGSPLEKSAFTEGVQGYFGNNSTSFPPLGVDGGNNLLLLAKKMELERQRSLPDPYQYWPGRDSASMVAKSEVLQDSLTPHNLKLLSAIVDNPRQTPQSQGTDLMSILQGLSDRPSSGSNNSAPSWSNVAPQRAPDPLQGKIDLHHDQNFPPPAPFGIPQQRLQPQNQPSLTNVLSLAIENSSGISTPEKLLSSGLAQDPQLFNILQQQYLLQLHSRASFPTQQTSQLDKLLLLKQQQKQEEQQQQILRQQQLLSQVLSEHQAHQRFSEPSFGRLQPAPISMGIPAGYSRIQPSQEMLHTGSQPPVMSVQGERAANPGNFPLLDTQDVSYNNVIPDGSSFLLPPQIFGDITRQKSWSAAVSEQVNDVLQTESFTEPKYGDSSPFLDMMRRSTQDPSFQQQPFPASESLAPEILEHVSEHTLKAGSSATLLESEANSVPFEGPDSVAVQSAGTLQSEVSVTENANDVKIKLESVFEEQQVEKDTSKDEPSVQVEVKSVEVREPRKASEKKSKKQKSSKLQAASDQEMKGVSKTPSRNSKQPENGKPEFGDLEVEADFAGEVVQGTSQKNMNDNKHNSFSSVGGSDSQVAHSAVPASFSGDDGGTIEVKDSLPVGSASVPNTQIQNAQRAWKPAPGYKAKSLLEIQEEEQKKARTEMVVSEVTSVNSTSLSTPWAGVVASSDKAVKEAQRDSGKTEFNYAKQNSVNSMSKKSQLHDQLAEDVLVKSSSEGDEVPECPPLVITHSGNLNDENFIEAKDTKKSRKKSAKAKGAGKASIPVASVDVPVTSSPIEKGKSSRPAKQEKEAIPTIPLGPSLGDFVLWKGDSANASPSPAWSTDSGKVPKPTSLRDIQKEQGKRFSSQHTYQTSTPQKSQPAQMSRSSAPSRALAATSPSKPEAPIQILSQASSHSKSKADDDLFWGPVDQSKKETQHATQSSWGIKTPPGKGTSTGALGRQKSSSGKITESSLSSSPAAQSSLKGKRDAMSKHSEAMDFRDWCENEYVRLIGTKDMSFLEFCWKQTRSEAELTLIENLGSYDPNHEFIDKFLNYKELLPADVLDIAFQSRNDRKVTGISARDVTSDDADIWGTDYNVGPEASSKGGGKKKGKKGKKVSPSVLGFNVVSNRIMMGEIQTVED